MHSVALRRSLAAAAAITLLTIPSASAETVVADHDLVSPGAQNVVDLGTAQPGADIPVDVFFTLTCSGTNHVNATQTIKLTPATQIAPSGGGYANGTLNFGLGSAWPADGEACPSDLLPTVGGPLHMIITAPTTPGDDYRYFFSWTPTVMPPSQNDVGVFEGDRPSMTFLLDVPGTTEPPNTPPTLHLPADSTVEGNTTGGATAAYTATATDAEDAVAPTASCTPVVGSLLPLGQNTISCSATDTDGDTATGSFKITVVDTTAPVIGSMADVDVTTADPSGAVVGFSAPTATDVVDSSPVVGCSPASGTRFAIGTTTVTCTARDASGNSATTTFAVRVTLAQVVFEDPVGASAGIVVNGSRSVPVKAQILVGGRAVTSGTVLVTLKACDGGPALDTETLTLQSNGRWMGHLSTDGLANGCYRATVTVDGLAVGGFRIDVRPDTTAPATKPLKGKTKP